MLICVVMAMRLKVVFLSNTSGWARHVTLGRGSLTMKW